MQKTIWGGLQKVDDNEDGTITVYGVASSEERDSAGEIILADAMRAAIPGYMSSYPALREMHQLSAAGRTLELSVDDDGVTHIAALVTDPVAVLKVRTKTYSGFSVGGKVLSRDASDPTIITALDLKEVSLVDRPCLPSARLTLFRADDFNLEGLNMDPNEPAAATPPDAAPQTGSAPAAEAVEKAADAPVQADAIVEIVKTEPEVSMAQRVIDGLVKAGVIQSGTVGPDGALMLVPNEAAATDAITLDASAGETPAETVAKAEDAPVAAAVQKAETAAAAEPDVAKADDASAPKGEAETAAAAEAAPAEDAAKADAPAEKTAAQRAEEVVAALEKMAKGEDLKKGLYDVARLGELLSSLAYLIENAEFEAEIEGDNSPVPASLREPFAALVAAYKLMAVEEVDELAARVAVQKAAKGESISGQADATAGAQAGLAKAAGADEAAAALAKAEAQVSDLTKRLSDQDALFASFTERLEKANADLAKRLEAVEAQPLPPKTAAVANPPVVTAVTKADDSAGAAAALAGAAPSEAEIAKALSEMDPQERALILIKASHALPRFTAPAR